MCANGQVQPDRKNQGTYSKCITLVEQQQLIERLQATVPGKLVGKTECTGHNLRFDPSKVDARAAGLFRSGSRATWGGNVVRQLRSQIESG